MIARLGILLAVLGRAHSDWTYSDSFARNVLYPMSAAAFSDNPQTCVTNRIPGATVQRRVQVKCDIVKEDSCLAFTVLSPNDKAIILSFRGSEKFQVEMEVVESLFLKQEKFPTGGLVDKYFYDAFIDLWNSGIKDSFNAMRSAHPDYEVWITGHSLGAAMAALCASYVTGLGMVDGQQVKIITFGEPRSGDKTWATNFDQKLPNVYRVIHHLDIVPHLPLMAMDYEHHTGEVWYDNDMADATYEVCSGDENKKCSDGALDIIFEDHMHYFNMQIGDFVVQKRVEVQCDPTSVDTCLAYTVLSPNDKAIIIAFRGSNSDFQVALEVIEGLFEKQEKFPTGGLVAKYFYDAFLDVWKSGIKDSFNTMRTANPGYEVWVTGHSLGATMAALCASYLTNVGLVSSDHLKLITFGEPRSGDSAWVDNFNQQVPNAYRVIHHHDIVPHLPLRAMNYEHHKGEIWYNNDMSDSTAYKQCKGNEDSTCSDSTLDISMDDHMHYFNVEIEDFAAGGCIYH